MPLKYLDELKELNLPQGKYAVWGSGPLAIRDLRENKDIDLVVSLDLWNKLDKKYPRDPENSKKAITLSENITAFNSRLLYEKLNLKKDVEFIDNTPFIKLEKILEGKKKYYRIKKRKKEYVDIKLIKNFLKS